MWFEDLSPWSFAYTETKLMAVGWLDRGKAFVTGQIDEHVYVALAEMSKNPWQPFVSAGVHACNLCRFEPEARSSANLFIPAEGMIFVCPAMIVHYMNAHGYAPPDVFCRAVLACPPMRSMAYLRAIVSSGGARLSGAPGSGSTGPGVG